MVDMNDSRSLVKSSRFYEQLKDVNDTNTLCCELKALDAMNNSKLWMI